MENYLLVGSDSRALGDPNTGQTGDVTGNRSDTIMVLRVDNSDGSASLLGHDSLEDDETRFCDLAEHVHENALDWRQTSDFVEGILETGVRRVVLGKAGNAFGAESLEKGDQRIDGQAVVHAGFLHFPARRRSSGK